MSSARNLLRVRSGHQHNRVTFVELFFDLVFVFAVTQLSHTLIEHFSFEGAVQTMQLVMAVWWLWVYTTWVINWLDPNKLPVRLMLLAIMLSSLLLSASIPEAYGSRGLVFAAAYSLTHIGRTVFMIWAVSDEDQVLKHNFQRILAWLLVAAMFWFAGAMLEGYARFMVWALALLIEYLGPAAGFWTPVLGRSRTNEWMIEGGHLAERCGLFIILSLGESILVMGGAFSTLEWTAPTVAAFVTSFVGSLALWWLYFDTTAEAGSMAISESSDPGRLGRFAYTYIHVFIVAGIIVSAVGDEVVLAHPTGHTELEAALTVLGGPILYLIGTTLFEWTFSRSLSRSHGAGIVALLALAPLSTMLPPLAVQAVATGVLVLIAAWDARARRERPAHHLAGIDVATPRMSSRIE